MNDIPQELARRRTGRLGELDKDVEVEEEHEEADDAAAGAVLGDVAVSGGFHGCGLGAEREEREAERQ